MRTSPKLRWDVVFYATVLSVFSCHRDMPPPMSSPRIVGGRITESPSYMAGLVDDGGTFAFCGGSFIAPRIVVTAAHCVEDMQKKIFVSSGLSLNSQHSGAPLIPVEAILPHPYYDPTKLTNDIAILYLGSYDPAALPRPIIPITLNVDGAFPDEVPGTKVTVTGWGNTSSFGKLYDDPLRSADLDVVPVTRCSLAPGYDDVDERQICAGDLAQGGIDACNGDSGGPLVAKKADGSLSLVGVVSWGEGCALAGKPGVYTRVSAFYDWIQATVAQLQPRSQPLETREIRDLIRSYCYDGWAYNVRSDDSSHSLEVSSQFRVVGDFRESTTTVETAYRKEAYFETNLPLCWARLGDHLTLSGAVIFDSEDAPSSDVAPNPTETPTNAAERKSSKPRVGIMARQEDPYAVWIAPAKKISKLSLTCKSQPMSLRGFNPDNIDASFSFGVTVFDILSEELDGLSPEDERHTCSFEGHTVTYAIRKDANGVEKKLLQVSSPLFDSQHHTYWLADSASAKTKVEMRFRPTSDFTGNLMIRNLTNDDIHTWRLECNVPFGLIDEFGSYYSPLIRDGNAIHHFAKPSHFFATIRGDASVQFTYDGRVPLEQVDGLKCKINNQGVSLIYDPNLLAI
jgi:trypsin